MQMPVFSFLRNARVSWCLLVVGTLAITAIIYWPVRHAGFVWDDKTAFLDTASLRSSDWWHFLLAGVNDWDNYFRPLVLALYSLEIRLFDAAPMPLHLVSLALHLANTLLVGMLALRLQSDTTILRPCLAALAMLVYGLHPALVEPVVWISCQYDLVATLFVLLALWLNLVVVRTVPRALGVASCFFLGACAKESAACLPLLLVLFDAFPLTGTRLDRDAVQRLWRRQRLIYAGMLMAGIAYLALRDFGLGHLVKPIGDEHLFSIQHLQKICYTYLSYWRIGLWPMAGLGPLHIVDASRFAQHDTAMLGIDAASALIAGAGVASFLKGRPIGAFILAFSLALTPVLNIVPTLFVESLYHERYAMLAIAMAATWLPAVALSVMRQTARLRLLRTVLALCMAGWLVLAVFNVRAAIPVWSDELNLWQWASRQNPDSIMVKDHLLSEYMGRGDYASARTLARSLLDDKRRCANCLLNIAYLSLLYGNTGDAAKALARIKNEGMELLDEPRLRQGFMLATGELEEVNGAHADAESSFRDAIAADPHDPLAVEQLAYLLARQGRLPEARAAADKAIALFAPAEREKHRKSLDDFIHAAELRH
jgi:hypothetical protein